MKWLLSCLTVSIVVLPFSLRADEPVKRPSSTKGWEIYGKLDEKSKEWVFGVLEGSNRQKDAKEIDAALVLKGVDGLKKELSTIPAGDHVILNVEVPAAVRKLIADHCAKEKLKFQ